MSEQIGGASIRRWQQTFAPSGARVCAICGDDEPVHVHRGDERIEDYFVVGRGESDFMAARRWKQRALEAERRDA